MISDSGAPNARRIPTLRSPARGMINESTKTDTGQQQRQCSEYHEQGSCESHHERRKLQVLLESLDLKQRQIGI